MSCALQFHRLTLSGGSGHPRLGHQAELQKESYFKISFRGPWIITFLFQLFILKQQVFLPFASQQATILLTRFKCKSFAVFTDEPLELIQSSRWYANLLKHIYVKDSLSKGVSSIYLSNLHEQHH